MTPEERQIVTQKTPFEKLTRGVRVKVWPNYNEEQSKPQASVYVYFYTITIVNESSERLQLMSRHWEIRDGFGRVEHVIGEGVVGQQPTLGPGQEYTYTSSCPLQTPSGSMKGNFKMKVGDKETFFQAEVPEFWLRHESLLN